MKTLLMSIYDSNVARNILRTDVLRTLKAVNELRIVVLVPHAKLDAYTKEFASAHVVVDVLPKNNSGFLESLAINISRFSIPSHTVRQNAEKARMRDGVSGLPKYLAVRFLSAMAKFMWWKRIVRTVCTSAIQDHSFSALFTMYKPDLVFSATIYDANDFRLLKHCMRLGVKSIGMIKSWDNLTSKDFLLIPPHGLVVHNERIRDEAVTYGNYPSERIFVSGIPQFDAYTKDGFILSRDAFFSRFNLDPDKKLIVYAAVGSWLFPREAEAIAMLARVITSGTLCEPAQLYVRLHPAYTSEDSLLSELKGVTIFRPGKADPKQPGLRSAWEFDEEETQILASTIRWADVSINCGSTMSIESAFFDRPTINLDFDPATTNDLYWKSVRRMYRREHYVPLKRAGGIRFPKNEAELVRDLNAYIADPALNHDGRTRIMQEQCFSRDGMAGKRIAEYILSNL